MRAASPRPASPAAHAPPAGAPATPRGRAARWLRAAAGRLARGLGVVRAVVGAPDYDRYVAHCRARHPDAPVLDRAAFERERLAARYDRPGARCC
jgi:uncharacterized short protein YbdD (DUF466 family)